MEQANIERMSENYLFAKSRIEDLSQREKALQSELSDVQNEKNVWGNSINSTAYYFNKLGIPLPDAQKEAAIKVIDEIVEAASVIGLYNQVCKILSDENVPMVGSEIYSYLQKEYGYKATYVTFSGRLRIWAAQGDLYCHILKNKPNKFKYWYLLPAWLDNGGNVKEEYLNVIRNRTK